MKIEEGKYYRTRSGQKVGPMVEIKDARDRPGRFHKFTDGFLSWGAEGGALSTRGEFFNDLVEEWTDEQP